MACETAEALLRQKISRLLVDTHPVFRLRAERLPDGTRTFRIQPGKPLETSYGIIDLYRRILGPVPQEDLRASVSSV